MLLPEKRVIVVTGHYGSGKTNLSVNLALALQKSGKDTALIDLDIVNPYFRSADFAQQLTQTGIEMVLPVYANSNLDIPALTARMDGVIGSGKTVVIDVGGDDAGALALGRYQELIKEAGGCDFWYVINGYRFMTQTPPEAGALLSGIEAASHMKATAIVNNSNLGELTTEQTIGDSISFARETAALCQLPLLFTTVDKRIAPAAQALLGTEERICPVVIYVKKPWE